MAPRFFIASALDPARVGTSISLPEDIAHHAIRVLRLVEGSSITLFDGTGGEYAAMLVEVRKHEAAAHLRAFNPIDRESSLRITLVQAVLATDTMDYAVRKCVELGVSAIAPVFAARSQHPLAADKSQRRLLHWRSIAVASCEQCGRNRLPEIVAPASLATWLRESASTLDRPVIAAPNSEQSLASFAVDAAPDAIIIGPEGGFTDAEMALARSMEVVPVHLGPRVLRAETTGVAALSMLAAIAGDAR